MSHVLDYTFSNLTNRGEDAAYRDQRSVQNSSQCSYLTQNFFSADCTMRNPINLATTQPGVFYSGGNSVGAGGCNIDTSSNLQLGSIQTGTGAKLDLISRPYVTVPFLGRGAVDPTIEYDLLRGKTQSGRRTAHGNSEKSFVQYNTTPLIPRMQKRIHGAARSIEADTMDGWQRGGISTRDQNRDR
jgi:hypothetical protein